MDTLANFRNHLNRISRIALMQQADMLSKVSLLEENSKASDHLRAVWDYCEKVKFYILTGCFS